MISCKICGKQFEKQEQLKGHSSIHKAGGRYSVSRKKKFRYCLSCNKEVREKFCNVNCKNDYYWKERRAKIQAGEILDARWMRKFIEETKGNVCEHCTNSGEWNGKPLTLQLDHIDGNSDNNELSNLRILCPNCHTQTDTWCGRNKKDTVRNNYLREYKKIMVLAPDGTAPVLHTDTTRFDS